MIVYRICAKKFAHDLSGAGAEKYGGRWNNIGQPLLYTSAHRSLCVLELAVHTPLHLIKNMSLVLLSIQIPDGDAVIVPSKGLPYQWNQTPHTDVSQQFGDEFIKENKYLAMRVPSIIVREEYNILINPRHAMAHHVKLVDVVDFTIDNRLFK
jgi:RES domain-containing protein